MHRIALHSWTLGERPLPELIETARRAGYDAIEANWQDFARCRDVGVSARELRARLDDGGIEVAVVGVQPGWLFAEGGEAERWWEQIRRTADDALGVGCNALMSALGRTAGPVGIAEKNIRTVARLAAALGMSLAIEYNFGHPTLASLDSVRDLVRCAGSSHCGLVLDSYHLHRGGRPGRGFEAIETHEILHVQVSDVPAVPADDGGVPLDRLPPGAGQVDWTAFLQLLFEKGYGGVVSYEAPNPVHWARDPDVTAREGLRAIRDLMALARPVSDRSRSSG